MPRSIERKQIRNYGNGGLSSPMSGARNGKTNKGIVPGKGLQQQQPPSPSNFATKTKKENDAWGQNVIISEEIQSQVKFEVAVCLSTEMTSVQSLTNSAKQMPNRVVFSPVSHNCVSPKKPLTGKNQQKSSSVLSGPVYSNKTKPQKMRQSEEDISNENEGFVESAKVKLVTPAAASPKYSGGKRKINCLEGGLMESPQAKKHSSENLRSSSSKLSSSITTRTPKTSMQQKKASTPSNKLQPKVRKTPDRKNLPKIQPQNSKCSPPKGKMDQKRKANQSDCQSPCVLLKRQIYESPRPEGCVSPKRKPGTPWRECQLRKLAEEQKMAAEQAKAEKKQTEKDLSQSASASLVRSPLRKDNSLESPKTSQPPVENPSTSEESIKMRSPVIALTELPSVDSIQMSPSGSNVDSCRVQTSESSVQTPTQKTVLSRFKTKLTQSYNRTLEYFSEVKNIWDRNATPDEC